MNKILQALLIVATILPAQAFAANTQACLEKAMTQAAMNQCADLAFEEADAELNRVYQKIRQVYQEEDNFLNNLKKAQLAWIKLRDADVALMYPHAQEAHYYGSAFPMCLDSYKTQLTLQRVAFLKQWVIGTEEGDVCNGSQMSQGSLKEILKSGYHD